MSNNGSQKLDIADICDAVVGRIDGNVSDILTAATSESLLQKEMTGLEIAQDTLAALNEIVEHLRKITNEDFSR
jgi:hypothetical protein